MNNKILAVIPARGGSKGVLRKNARPLGGIPLVGRAIRTAIESDVLGKVVVSSEDEEILFISSQFGAEIIKRPLDLSGDRVLTEPVMLHALSEVEKNGFKPDFIALIQCTSPFLSAKVIREAVGKVLSGKFDSCITVFMPDGYEFKWRKEGDTGLFVPEHDVDKRPRRQDLDLPYHENGAFYITKTKLFKESLNRFGGRSAKITAVEMTEKDSLQIDSEYQFWLAEQIVKT